MLSALSYISKDFFLSLSLTVGPVQGRQHVSKLEYEDGQNACNCYVSMKFFRDRWWVKSKKCMTFTRWLQPNYVSKSQIKPLFCFKILM